MSKLKTVKNMGIRALAPIAFYGVVGILFLVLLPFANFPPHIGLTGIMSLITAYGIFTKRSWATWLIVALFFVATTLSMYTLYYIMFSNWIVSISMIAYAVLTWVFTARTLLKRKSSETEA
jgi:SNF family Na+-dependent transporter